MENELNNLSITELKALIYDELVNIELWQKHIANCQTRIKAITEAMKIKKVESE